MIILLSSTKIVGVETEGMMVKRTCMFVLKWREEGEMKMEFIHTRVQTVCFHLCVLYTHACVRTQYLLMYAGVCVYFSSSCILVAV